MSMAASSDNNTTGTKPPLVVILGATGVGKSRLAIDLACHFSAEVVNADSMQVYKGLDILTNKVPIDERRGVPHHLLGFVEPNEEFTAKQFRDLAVIAIEDILQRQKLPILVGGTNYYIQALVSSYLLDDILKYSEVELEDEQYVNDSIDSRALAHSEVEERGPKLVSTSKDDTNNLYELLKLVDPQAVDIVHPNNIRRLDQYIKIYKRTGRRPSELFQDKRMDKWGTSDSFRYNCCFILLDAEVHILGQFVEQRVDAMVELGLLKEISNFYAPGADYSRGLYQAIGVSEFSSVFDVEFCEIKGQHCTKSTDEQSGMPSPRNSGSSCTPSKAPDSTLQGETILRAVNKMKSNTRRLVHLQKRRFLKLETQFGWHFHRLDVTDILRQGQFDDIWANNVLGPAKSIVEKFLEGLSEGDLCAPQISTSLTCQRQIHQRFICEPCNGRIFLGQHQWQEHSTGRAHKKRMANFKKSGVLQSLPKV